jgi:hypothetical protein
VWTYLFFATNQTLMMTVVDRLSKGSILLAMVFHFSNNMAAFTQNIPPSFNERVEMAIHVAVGAACAAYLLT